MEKNLDYQLYVQRENNFYHEPYSNEQFIYNAIKNGDTESIIKNQQKYGNIKPDGKGTLSDNDFKNQLYHMIINTAIITRLCTSCGLPRETAYTLSDMYISKADKATTIQQIMNLNDEMTLEFAELMKELNGGNIFSKTIRQTINYICDNLHKKLMVEELSKNAGYNRSYLSILFKKETGRTLNQYIKDKRLETAKNMLMSSDYTSSEIANTLCFSSQSHFCKLFKERYGETPRIFKDKNIII